MVETKFKETEVGLVPVDWEMNSIDELFDLGNGYTPSKANPNFWNNGTIPWFRMEDIRANGRILRDSIQHITSQAVKGGGLFPANSIILSTTATIGEHALLIVDSLANQQFTFLNRKVNREKDLDIKYFFHYCFILGDWCRANINDGGLMAVNIKDLKEHLLPLPPLPEQRRIASALSSVDELISSLDTLIEKKQNIKLGAMQQLLTGKKRLKGFNQPWVEKSIDDICERLDNLRIPISESNRRRGSTPYYGANGIQDFVEGYTHDGEYILLAEDGANSLSDYPIRYVMGKIWVNNHAHVLQAKKMIADNKFLSYSFKNIDFESNIVGCGRAKLNSQTLMLLKVLIPSTIEEQRAIAAVLTNMDNDIAALEQKRDKYITVKQGMMQQLLTGKIRLI